MARTVRNFSLYRVVDTELRIVSDVETGTLPVIQTEESVIRGYIGQKNWPHRWVSLFILQDLQPLIRQLHGGGDIPAGGTAAMDERLVVNVYDLADLAGCHVFVNQQAMVKAGCWDDPLAIQGLLAHEHAHPISENKTTQSSRRLRVELTLEQPPAEAGREVRKPQGAVERQDRIRRLLTLLADELCLYAPREIFANEMTLRSGFGEALLYLDRRNVANASRSVAGRADLRRQLQQEVTEGNLSAATADALLLIGDLRGYLNFALEVAPFQRIGRASDARELETVLETNVFPHLEPEASQAYAALQRQYVALRADLTVPELMTWGREVLDILTEVLARKNLAAKYRLVSMTAN